AHGRHRALRLAAVRARLPAPAERRDDDGARPAPRGRRYRARGARGGLSRARAERPHEVRGMSDPLLHVKPAVRAAAGYTLAARRAPVKINQNENPFDMPEAVKRRVLDEALSRPWSRYPDFDPRELPGKLAPLRGWG